MNLIASWHFWGLICLDRNFGGPWQVTSFRCWFVYLRHFLINQFTVIIERYLPPVAIFICLARRSWFYSFWVWFLFLFLKIQLGCRMLVVFSNCCWYKFVVVDSSFYHYKWTIFASSSMLCCVDVGWCSVFFFFPWKFNWIVEYVWCLEIVDAHLWFFFLVDSGLWGWSCKSTMIARENCALRCLSPACYELIYESDPVRQSLCDTFFNGFQINSVLFFLRFGHAQLSCIFFL